MLFKNITIIGKDYQVIKDGYLATDGKKITYIGEAEPSDYIGEIYDGTNKVAMPGFFNIHCHVPMVMLRGCGEGLPLDRWLNEKIFPFEALLTHDDMYWGTLLGVSEMIKSGAVSFTDMYMKIQSICKAIDESGMKVNICNGATSFAQKSQFIGCNEYNETMNIVEYIKNCGHDRIIVDAGIHAEYTSNPDLVRSIGDYAKEHNMRVHLHLSETRKEHNECKERRGKTPAQYFESLGVFGAPTTAAHCVWLDDGDFEILARNNVTVAHCPSSNLKLGSGIANIKKMLESGVNVGIGTDGAASNNNLNVIEEVNLAALVQKGATQDPMFLGTADILKLSCKNGAISQGRVDCGSIEVGNRADIVVYDLDKPHLNPVIDVISNILYSAQSDDIVLSMIDGEVVYRDGEFKNIDIEKVVHNVRRITREKLEKLNA